MLSLKHSLERIDFSPLNFKTPCMAFSRIPGHAAAKSKNSTREPSTVLNQRCKNPDCYRETIRSNALMKAALSRNTLSTNIKQSICQICPINLVFHDSAQLFVFTRPAKTNTNVAFREREPSSYFLARERMKLWGTLKKLLDKESWAHFINFSAAFAPKSNINASNWAER